MIQESCVHVEVVVNLLPSRERPHRRPPLARVPRGVPIGQSWHVVRATVEDEVYKILRGDEPAVAALAGRSGAGKSNAAAAMVGERQGLIRPRAGETEDQARTRLERVRALFPDGVVWLPVGKGATDRLPDLMLKLAKALREDMMDRSVAPPAVGEDGASYVKKILKQKSKRCLVVADNVWEEEVVEKLKETGMWVLLTTRKHSMVENSVSLEELTQAEAEDVLRGAAGLPLGERLNDAATDVLKICGHVAMDIAFVGSWSTVRTANGVPKSSMAWAGAVEEIEAKGGGVNAERDANRLSVLRAGFEYLAREDPLAQKLYVALAVLPNGFWFNESVAKVLLTENEKEAVMDMISILERWGVLKADASGEYRMHDAHVDLTREELMHKGKIRKQAVDTWTEHISRLEFAIGVDVYALLRCWRAVVEVGGEGWWVTRPYDDQLIGLDAMDRSKVLAVDVVAQLYYRDQQYVELGTLMEKVREQCDYHEEDCTEVQMAALHVTMTCLYRQGRYQEGKYVERRLGDLIGPGVQLQTPDENASIVQRFTTFRTYGVYAKAAGHHKDAEKWLRKVLNDAEGVGVTGNYQIGSAYFLLGLCVWEDGRPGEAGALFQEALMIEEAMLGPDDVQVAVLLHNVGVCLMKVNYGKKGASREAEELFKRALMINETKLGPDDVGVANTLHAMGVCVRDARRLGEAEESFKRALMIKEAKLGPTDVQVAVTLHAIGVCVRDAGRAGEAEESFKRALMIKEAKLGPNDVQVACTLHEMGVCVRDAGRAGEAEELFKRALMIKEAKLGPNDVQVACTLHEMGVCVRDAGRAREAEELFKRALMIKEAKGISNFRDFWGVLESDVGVVNCAVEEGLYECCRPWGRFKRCFGERWRSRS